MICLFWERLLLSDLPRAIRFFAQHLDGIVLRVLAERHTHTHTHRRGCVWVLALSFLMSFYFARLCPVQLSDFGIPPPAEVGQPQLTGYQPHPAPLILRPSSFVLRPRKAITLACVSGVITANCQQI